MKRHLLIGSLLLSGLMLVMTACSGDPNVEGAKLALTQDDADLDQALANLEESIANNPENAEAYFVKAQVLQKLAAEETDAQAHTEHIEEMVTAYQRALELDPENGDIIQQMRLAYVDEFQRGIQAFNRGREDEASFSEAVTYFRNTSMIMPDSSGPYVNEAYALINAGRPEEAIEPFEKAMAAGETEGDTYLLLADIYQRNERVEDAVALLEEARTMYPDREDIQSQLLNAYIAAGQVDRAEETYREAVQREPDNKLYRYNYGSLLLQAEDYEGAIEQLTAATNLDSEYGIAFYNLGAAYVNQAVDVNDEIQTVDDDLRANRASLSEDEIAQKEAELDALVEERRGLFEQAIAPLERARELQDAAGEDTTATCSALFQSYVQTGQEDKAQDAAQCAGIDLN